MAEWRLRNYSHPLGVLVVYPGDSLFPWVPEDDWDGDGFDYPPAGSRAIGELHTTRRHYVTGLVETTMGGSNYEGISVMRPSESTKFGWGDWEQTSVRNIKIDNILARLEAAGYSGEVTVEYDNDVAEIGQPPDEEVQQAAGQSVEAMIESFAAEIKLTLEWTERRDIEFPLSWSRNDFFRRLQILVNAKRIKHKEIFGTHYYRRLSFVNEEAA